MKNAIVESVRDEAFVFKVYSRKELADLYGVTVKTFSKWIKPFEQEMGPRMGNLFTPKQLKIIISWLDYP